MQTGIGRNISDTNQAPIKRSNTCMYFPRVSFLSQKFNHDVMDKEFELQLRRGLS